MNDLNQVLLIGSGPMKVGLADEKSKGSERDDTSADLTKHE